MLILKKIFRSWQRIGHFIGDALAFVIMLVVFYLVLTPLALVRRILGQDPIRKTFRRCEGSYKVTSESTNSIQFERPF